MLGATGQERMAAGMPTATVGRSRHLRSIAPGAAAVGAVGGLVLLGTFLPVSRALIVEDAIGLSVFALSTNLLLGYAGLVSFGQATFYGAGAYTVMLGWQHWGWSFWLGFLLAPLVGAGLALVVGLVSLRARRLYFALLTLAFTQLAYVLAQQRYSFTGGDNGVFGAVLPHWLADPRRGYMFTLAVATLCCAALWRIVASPYGLLLRAIRENRDRLEALGVNVFLHQLVAFVVSGAFGAIAGVLFVVHSQSAYPQLLEWTKSGEPTLMAVIGGMFAFLGPAVGAFLYVIGNEVLVQYTTHWQLILGSVLLLVVLVRPDGLAGAIGSRLSRHAPPPGREEE